MVKLSDLLSLEQLEKEIKTGFVKRALDPTGRFAILSYTNKAQISNHWPPERLLARGLVYRVETLKVVARPLPKFFNYGEKHAPLSGDEPVVVTDKLDGSLGILFFTDDGQPHVVTRGSFVGAQAEHATKLYRERYHGKWTPLANKTYLFEIIYPDNRIVLDYKDTDDLFGLCAVCVETGEVTYDAKAWQDWPGPRTQVFAFERLSDAVRAPPRKGAEGLVVQLANASRLMVKIKQDDYKALHKAQGGLTPMAIWEALTKGASADDICGMCDIDEEHALIRKLADELTGKFTLMHQTVLDQFTSLQAEVSDDKDKKLFAIKAQAFGKDTAKLLFALRSGKSIADKIWALIKPS